MTENSPFSYHHTFALSLKEELIYSVFFGIKMLLVKGLQTIPDEQRRYHSQI